MRCARCPRVQVHLIQYPGPAGSRHVDRLVADAVAAPPDLAAPARADPLALLPPPYQVPARQRGDGGVVVAVAAAAADVRVYVGD